MISLLLKVTVVLAIGLVLAKITSRTRASVRHAILASALAATVALPLAGILVPAFAVHVPMSRLAAVVPAVTSVPSRPATTRAPSTGSGQISTDGLSASFSTLLRAAWAIGGMSLLAFLCAGVWRLSRTKRTAVPWLEGRDLLRSLTAVSDVRRHVDVVVHEDAAAPFVCGLVRPAIVLPPDARTWSDDDVRRTLVHELEHVHRGDWAVQILARGICAAYWFHPLVWLVLRRLTLEAERACDDAVLRISEQTEYAEQLVALAERIKDGSPRPVPGMANRSDLAARVTALLDSRQRRGRPGAVAVLAATAGAAIIALALGSVRVVGASAKRIPDVTGSSVSTRDEQRNRGSRADRALYRAAERGDLDRIAALMRDGANVNARLEGDGTPLIGAARKGHAAAVRLLLDSGADPNLAVQGDGNPLIMAARAGHVDVVELLLTRGAAIDQIVDGDENALIQASGEGHLAVVKLLVARGADVNARAWADAAYERPDGEWRTPLKMALRGRHEQVAAFLRSAGAKE